ncbi:MAG: winged helix-turn-helix transcriptional regulator [Saprospiraceae bacterium]|nr:winged helix-turn-helix transcriptional regulator [Saprospiraceae bacterium]
MKLIASFQKALSHPARIQIMIMLMKKEHQVNQIAKAMPLCKASVSHHLQTLREAGLIKANGDGPDVSYEVVESGCRQAGKVISRFVLRYLLSGGGDVGEGGENLLE